MNYPLPAIDPFSIAVEESSQVGEARRLSAALARAVGMNDTTAGEVSIVATELASNLLKHAAGGELIVRSIGSSIEFLAIDRGPGLKNPATAMSDGYSTGGTAGTGLGAVRRLAKEIDLFSQFGRGTVIVARMFDAHTPPPVSKMIRGAVSLPKPTEEVCGDGWSIADDNGRTVVLVVDGLGHGPQAAKAAQSAVRVFRESFNRTSSQIIEAIHAALRSTRGAAVAVVDIHADGNEVAFTGIGNIAGTIVTDAGSRSMVSHAGTAGAEARRIQEFSYPWSAESMLIMHSDGLAGHWDLKQYPGLRMKDPSVIAGVLYRDHRRIRDDATVLVLRPAEGKAVAPAAGRA